MYNNLIQRVRPTTETTKGGGSSNSVVSRVRSGAHQVGRSPFSSPRVCEREIERDRTLTYTNRH